MRIIALASENVKRLKAIEIHPKEDVVVVGGRNAQGKTSVLDSIMFALGGKPKEEMPVRRGKDKATIRVDLGDLVVTRTMTATGGGSLKVSGKDGSLYPSPQKILDKLAGQLTFDPLSFMRMFPKDQLDYLRDMAGLDFSDLERKHTSFYEERRDINRQAKEIVPEAICEDTPDEEVSISALVEELNEANESARAHADVTRFAADAAKDAKNMEERIAETEELLSTRKAKLVELNGYVKAEVERMEKMVIIDPAPIQARVDSADATNQRVRQNHRRIKALGAKQHLEKKSAELTKKLDWIGDEKKRRVKEAKLPLDGLGIGDGYVEYRGVPIDQASSAEQLIISAAMGLAVNPRLRILLIRDGSLLDDESLASLKDWASGHDCQVWIERVGADDECSIIIEDGSVKE